MSASAPPGWYPDPDPRANGGRARWWDGTAWTADTDTAPAGVPSSESRGWAVAAHLSPIAAVIVAMGFLGPLAVYLVKADDPFVREQAREALNFQLSALLWAAVAVLLILFLVGIVLALVFAFAWLVCVISGAVRASRGDDFRYPLTIRFVR